MRPVSTILIALLREGDTLSARFTGLAGVLLWPSAIRALVMIPHLNRSTGEENGYKFDSTLHVSLKVLKLRSVLDKK